MPQTGALKNCLRIEDDTVITPEPVRTGFDSGTLKDYVIKHSDDLKDFVLNTVLAS